MCRCLIADARQYLQSLLYEQVTDADTRGRLRSAGGFCNWHAWMLRETSDPAFGTAILYEDLLRLAIQRFEQAPGELPGRPRGRSGWLGRLAQRLLRTPLAMSRPRPICPGCQLLAECEEHYLRTVLQFIDDADFDQAYWRSQGLCVPHVWRALEIGGGAAGARRLLARTLPKWAEIRRDLQSFLGKHDHRNRQPFTEAESLAGIRALETLAGASGLFGNDVRPSGTR